MASSTLLDIDLITELAKNSSMVTMMDSCYYLTARGESGLSMRMANAFLDIRIMGLEFIINQSPKNIKKEL